jgi:hypothetical protein
MVILFLSVGAVGSAVSGPMVGGLKLASVYLDLANRRAKKYSYPTHAFAPNLTHRRSNNKIMSSPQRDILYLLSQYELLEITAQNLSTLDLYNLALSCGELYERILRSKDIFNQLKRLCLCDGRGLKARQEFSGIYALTDWVYPKSAGKTAEQVKQKSVFPIPSWAPPPPVKSALFDQELEIRVWNLKCDAANALPCLRCGVNVCEVCLIIFILSQIER